MLKVFIYSILLIFFNNAVFCFIQPLVPQTPKVLKCASPICNERTIYSTYLIGLRKTKRLLKNNTNLNNIINFTHVFISNYSIPNEFNINNTDTQIKSITMGNIILDVSNVQYIHISTKNDKIIVELDKHQENVFSVLQKVSSIDSIVNAILLFGKILNITP
jgi:hypothetical protein